MESFVFFGKGGIGKSTIASNLSALYGISGKKVLHIGCDPKHDSSVSLCPEGYVRTFMEQVLETGQSRLPDNRPLTLRGRFGVDIVEAGGPEPGVGCAGRGISLMLETFQARKLLEDGRYEVVVFDILGDVVCGGFATPLRRGFGKKVFIVVSEELMSLYAANNIAKAVRSYREGGVVLAGLVANVRDPEADRRPIERFAELIGTKVVASIPRDPAVREAEYRRRSVVEHAPDSPAAQALLRLSALALRIDPRRIPVPSPLEDRAFYELSLRQFRGGPAAGDPPSAKAPRRARRAA